MERRIRIGELLIRAGLINEMQLNAALAEQKKWGGRLGRILVDMNYISEDILTKGLARLLNVPRADFTHIEVPPQILDRFDFNDCQARGYLPLRYSAGDNKLLVAMTDVNNLELVDELRFKLGINVEPAIAGEHALIDAARRVFYGAPLSDLHDPDEPSFRVLNNQGSTIISAKRAGRAATAEPVAAVAIPGASDVQAEGAVVNMEATQRRQARAIKTLLELLIEKGIFTRAEFMAFVSRPQD